MRFRIFFFLVTVFFVAMNLLLWRSEFTQKGRLTSPVPAEVVWRKILTAPDNSRLAIEHRGTKMGYCTWAPNVQEGLATGKVMTDSLPPEGMIKQWISYTLDLDGSVSLDADLRLRFNLHLKFNTNQVVEELVATVRLRPDTWELRANASEQTVTRHHDAAGGRTSRVYGLSDARLLEDLLRDLDLAVPPGTLAALGLGFGESPFTPATVGLEWATSNDWLQMGHARFRVYRMDLGLLGQYQASLFVSLIGEILRMELPGQWVLQNDGLIGLE